MKKILLLAGAAMLSISAMMAEEIDITPKNYHFNTAETLPFHPEGFSSANINAPAWATADGNAHFNDGLIAISGGQMPARYADVKGMCGLVDLGGTVGKVFAMVGGNSDVNDALRAIYGEDYGLDAYRKAFFPGFYNLFFFTDPNDTPTDDTGKLHVKITYNIYNPTYSASTFVNKIYAKDNDNNVQPQDDNNAPGIRLGDCMTENEEETMVYDPTKWVVYEFDTECPMMEDDGRTYVPMRIEMECPASNGNGATATGALFIKDITITYLPDEFEFTNAPGTRNISYATYTPGTPDTDGVDTVEAALDDLAVDINGNHVTFSRPAEVYTTAGVLVASGREASLPAGIYVARSGNRSVKIAVR